MKEAFRTLYSQGGVPRFYKGLLPALFQARCLRAWRTILVFPQPTSEHTPSAPKRPGRELLVCGLRTRILESGSKRRHG